MFIGASTRLISDILETTDSFNIDGYILTADIEKAFDSMDQTLLLAVQRKSVLKIYFIDLVKRSLTTHFFSMPMQMKQHFWLNIINRFI